ncbi:MAG: DUF922 domain-containing protein [Alphaproteobacteria bacterium]|nr:DUF922 domain-containing protein [Alphaproteobacteria bacterium]MCB9697285.1 DUF922 domain-containing protein [Alphaproteobacteria bacterium]
MLLPALLACADRGPLTARPLDPDVEGIDEGLLLSGGPAGDWVALAVDGADRVALTDEGSWVRWRFDAGSLVEVARGRLEVQGARGLARTPAGWLVATDSELLYVDASLAGPPTMRSPAPLPDVTAVGRTEGEVLVLARGAGMLSDEPVALREVSGFEPVALSPLGEADLMLVEQGGLGARSAVRWSRWSGTAIRGDGEPVSLGQLAGSEALPLGRVAAATEGRRVELLWRDPSSWRGGSVWVRAHWTLPMPTIEGAEVVPYALEGSTVHELARSCVTACPRGDDGSVVRGLTRWELRWTWEAVPAPEPLGCRVTDARAHVELKVHLPAWDPPADVDPDLLDRFPAYLDGLAAHERDHVRLVLEAAREGEGVLPTLTCAEAEERARRWVIDLRLRHQELDFRTGHGASQGARLSGG